MNNLIKLQKKYTKRKRITCLKRKELKINNQKQHIIHRYDSDGLRVAGQLARNHSGLRAAGLQELLDAPGSQILL